MASSLLTVVQIYSWIGLGVAAVFLLWGVDRVMAAARGAYAFRPLLLPGVVLLWPLVLWRWLQLERSQDLRPANYRPPRRLQDGLALGLAVVLPILLLGALLVRQDGPFERPAQQLAAPTAEESSQ
ncbi:MAG: hypothetical protein AAFY02_09325 [Pseudomonadota bacterium]